ncbi:tyrosine-type recombinase/integrase [Intestinibacter sp.]
MSDIYTGCLYKRYGKDKKSFTYYYKIKCGSKVILNKSCKTSVKREANKMLDNAIYELEHGRTSLLSKDMTLNKYLEAWLENDVKLNSKYNTYETYSKLINRHIKNTVGNYKIRQLNTLIMQQVFNDMYKAGYSKSTLELTKNLLSGAFKSAIQTYNLINSNPVSYVKIPKYEIEKELEVKDKIITIKQFNKLIELNPVGTDLYMPFQIAFNTGMRRGEVLALKWENIDFDNKIIHIKKNMIRKGDKIELSTPKTKSSIRDITIGNTLLKILKAHKIRQKENKLKYGKLYIDSDFICTTEIGNPISVNMLDGKMHTLNKKIDFPFTFHYLRHTHTTLLIEAGANIKDVQKRLGHSKLSTTMDTYSHVTDKMKNETVEIFEKLIK